jgi:DNA-binding transcriptional LysR family regulator
VLTEEGKKVLGYVQAILSASERLDEVALSLAGETEARLTFVLSDTLHPDVLEELMVQFDRQFPHTEFECLIGEDVDVIDLLQKERAQVGLIEARDHYPTDIGATRLPMQTLMGLYVAASHPLAKEKKLQWDQLHTWRELRLNTYIDHGAQLARGPVWSAPNYLLLLSMAVQGFGWCALPCALVEEFAAEKPLVQLDVPGWPKAIAIDLLWNKKSPPGAAGSWLRYHLQQGSVPGREA